MGAILDSTEVRSIRLHVADVSLRVKKAFKTINANNNVELALAA